MSTKDRHEVTPDAPGGTPDTRQQTEAPEPVVRDPEGLPANDQSGSPRADEDLGPDEVDALRGMLRRTFASDDTPDLLSGVQRRIRQRSQGKFYADGWSTAREPPLTTYLVTAVLMIFFMLFVWAALGSPAGEPVDVPNAPAPVRLMPPAPSR